MYYVKSSASFKSRSKRYRARRRRRIAAVGAIVLLVLVAGIALWPRRHASRAAGIRTEPTRAATALQRRAALWSSAAAIELQHALRAALSPALAGAQQWSCAVVAADGTLLYDDRSSHAITPASVQKLIVADAALTQLGPRYRFDTLLAAQRAPHDGIIDGNLWLAGSGDPAFRSNDLQAAVASLRSAGIRIIRGGVVVDGSAIAGSEINPYWNADDSNEDFMSATSGVSIDEDTVEFHVTGTQPGEAAKVRIRPFTPDVRTFGSVRTGGDDVIIAATQTPNEFRLAGQVPAGVEETFYLPVHGIDRYAGAVLAADLKAAGIDFDGNVQTGTLPLDARVLWEHRSAPLRALVQHMLVFSDNHFAEQLMRAVGGESGETADDAHGLRAERAVLASQNIPTPGLRIVDGSGLAHANRVAAITLARILARYDSMHGENVLYPLLPRGGRDGTLRMYHFTSARNRVRAKSGHVEGVSSLAGYVETRRHGRVVFAFLINGSPGDPDAAIVSAVDRLAER